MTSVSNIVFEELQSSYVAAECARRPVEERNQFQMAFACYVLWLAKVALDKRAPKEEVASEVRTIHATLTKLDWYQAGAFEKIWDEIQDSLPFMRPGRHSGVIMPLVHVIEAANRAGCTLSHSTDAEFNVYCIVLMKSIPESLE
jgi:hypothetical protein